MIHLNWTSCYLDLLLAAWVMLTIQVQGFHDKEGNRKSNRRTPLLSLKPGSLKRLRKVTAGIIVTLAFLFGVSAMVHFKNVHGATVLVCWSQHVYNVGTIISERRISKISSKETDETTLHTKSFIC